MTELDDAKRYRQFWVKELAEIKREMAEIEARHRAHLPISTAHYIELVRQFRMATGMVRVSTVAQASIEARVGIAAIEAYLGELAGGAS
ncbi:MAG: hypothetical protein AAGA17_00345 [Actinomycetota bacterium]